MPALPLDEAGMYVAAAYVVFVLLLGVYTTIISRRVSRNEREIMQLAESTIEQAALDQRELERGVEGLDREPAR